jgi:hypothetical protein
VFNTNLISATLWRSGKIDTISTPPVNDHSLSSWLDTSTSIKKSGVVKLTLGVQKY